MAERSSSFVSLLAAVVVAVAGLIPIIWLLTSPAEDSVVEEGVAVEQSSASSEAGTPPPEVTTVVVEPVPVLEVAELDRSIVRVLQANGYAELTGHPELGEELPDAITRVLIEHDAVLAVVEDDPAQEEG